MKQGASAAGRARQGAERRGRLAESLAALWLRAKGYRIVARRFRCRAGEVDILVRRGDLLVAVEVKARSRSDTALGGVTARQRRRIERAVSAYCARAGLSLSVRFDVVAVDRFCVPRHHVDAWRPEIG
ncbi:YraN family protein [Fodinicurvata sp. EGI_FJ10296]|uniref:YraN family protein n=1 Tax=Fodinicurvata sp. EGI_FJ10296 TaxID=3231908 RepID=UPI0034533563